MTTFRVNKKSNYTVIDNCFIDDSRLSLKAKGLMVMFLRRPDNWIFYLSELIECCKDGKDSMGSALKELEKWGYITRKLRRDSLGKLLGGYDYVIEEAPNIKGKKSEIKEIPNGENPKVEKYLIGNLPNKKNQKLLNTNTNINTDFNINTKISTTNSNDLKSIFESNICLLKKTTEIQFNRYLFEYDYNFVKAVILYCVRCKGKSFAYFKKTIDKYIDMGITTGPEFLNQVEKFIKEKYSNVKNKNGFVKKDVKSDAFNNFEQRKYDFEQLEKELLGLSFGNIDNN